MKLVKLLLTLPAIMLATAHAAEPQATPTQCLLPAEGGTAKVGKDGSFDVEKCLSKAGIPNFSRKGKTLTIFLAGGRKELFKDISPGREDSTEHRYTGYDPKTGFHQIEYKTTESNGLIFLDHESGFGFSSDVYAFSPDRQWVLGGGDNQYCERPMLAMQKIPARGQKGEATSAVITGKLGATDCETAIDPGALGFLFVNVNKVHWLSNEQVQIEWAGFKQGNEDLKKADAIDTTLLTLQGEQWVTDRLPFSGKQAVSKSLPTAQAPLQSGSLRTGMTLEEVEKLLGRSADRFKINPLALLGKQEITRVWTANGRQLEVTFVGGVVASWR